jgi:regulator of sigma E protease
VSAFLNGFLNVAIVLFVLVALVVLHELGHFLVARRAGVLVHEFGIGFPPRARVLHRGRETLYTLNWLPLGGFVRLEGENGDSDDPRSFGRQPLRTQTLILLAGVLMNLVCAWLIFTMVAGFADPSATIPLDYVFPGSPAAQAGLVGSADTIGGPQVRTGDTILGFNGQKFAYFDALQNDPLAYPSKHLGQRIEVTVQHADGSISNVTIQLRSAAEVTPTTPALGVAALTRGIGPYITRNPIDAVVTGLRRTWDATTLIINALGNLIPNLSNPQVEGPIGIVSTVGTVRTQAPPVFLIYLVGLLSANLAIINALPFPPLDGGRIVMGWIKAAARGRLSAHAEQATYLVGFGLLFAFIIYISFFDLTRLGGGG